LRCNIKANAETLRVFLEVNPPKTLDFLKKFRYDLALELALSPTEC